MSLDLYLSLDTLIVWKLKPYAMVEDLFGVIPDPWQKEALEAFPHAPRMAMKACAGPGKTALLAWLGWNFLLTRPHPMIGATSVNAANLRANLWTELACRAAGRNTALPLHHDEDRDICQRSSADLAARSSHLGAGRQRRADRQRAGGTARQVRHGALG
jgi:hypothetical protein